MQEVHRLVLAVLIALSVTFVARADVAPAKAKAGSEKFDKEGTNFVNNTGDALMFLTETSDLAATKADNFKIKTFAKQLSIDLKKSTDQLKAIAKKQGVAFPTQLASGRKDDMASLGKQKTPQEWDRKYLEFVPRDLGHLHDMLKAGVKNFKGGPDGDLEKFVHDNVSLVELNLNGIKTIQKDFK